jgi:hypothetical protein
MNRVSINLRLPADLHAALKQLAEQEDRSLTGQIIRLLREGIAREHDQGK